MSGGGQQSAPAAATPVPPPAPPANPPVQAQAPAQQPAGNQGPQQALGVQQTAPTGQKTLIGQ